MEEYFFVTSDNDDTVDRVKVSDIKYIALWATQLPSVFEYKEFPGYFKALEIYYADNYDRYKECYQKIVTTNDGKTFLDTTINLVLMEKQIEKIINKLMKDIPVMDEANKLKEQYTSLYANWRDQLEINHTTFAIDNFKTMAESYINWLDELSKTNPELAKEVARNSLITTGVLNENVYQKKLRKKI